LKILEKSDNIFFCNPAHKQTDK